MIKEKSYFFVCLLVYWSMLQSLWMKKVICSSISSLKKNVSALTLSNKFSGIPGLVKICLFIYSEKDSAICSVLYDTPAGVASVFWRSPSLNCKMIVIKETENQEPLFLRNLLPECERLPSIHQPWGSLSAFTLGDISHHPVKL